MFTVQREYSQHFSVRGQGSPDVYLFEFLNGEIYVRSCTTDASSEEELAHIGHFPCGTPLFPRFSDPNSVFCSTIRESGSETYRSDLMDRFESYTFPWLNPECDPCVYEGFHVRGQGVLYAEDAKNIRKIYLRAEELSKNPSHSDLVFGEPGYSDPTMYLFKAVLEYYLRNF